MRKIERTRIDTKKLKIFQQVMWIEYVTRKFVVHPCHSINEKTK